MTTTILKKYKTIPHFLQRTTTKNAGLRCRQTSVESGAPRKEFVLEKMDFDITIIDACYKAVVSQRYLNDDVAPVEASYKLLLPKSMTVTKFEVEIDGAVIRGIVKEKEEAKDDYEDAIAEGKSAFMMEQKESNKGNVYEISVGNLGPGASAVVVMELLGVVKYKEGEYLIDVPVEIMPAKSVDMNLSCRFNTAAPVLMAEGITGADFNFSDQTLMCTGKTPQNCLLLAFTTERAEPSLLIGDDEHMMVNFYPNWGDVDEDMVEPQCDVVFLVDRSGSMRGDRIKNTKKALQILVHAIPPDSKFNIVSFGGRFTKLFTESKEYDDGSLETASTDISSMDANYGGTNLISPLESILNENPDLDYPRSIFILTDGQVNDREGTIALVKRFSETCRVFVLGISSAVDKELVKGLAEAGNGSHDFVINSQDIEDVTMSLFMKVLEPSYRKISVGLPDSYSQVPSRIAPIRNGERLLAFGMPASKGASISGASINATDPYGEDFEVEMNNMKRIEGDIIMKFAAICRMNELEKENKKDEMIRLSIEYQIPSKHTAFVAVDERDNENVVEFSMKSTQVETVQVENTAFSNRSRKRGKKKMLKKAPEKMMYSKAPEKKMKSKASNLKQKRSKVSAPPPRISLELKSASPLSDSDDSEFEFAPELELQTFSDMIDLSDSFSSAPMGSEMPAQQERFSSAPMSSAIPAQPVRFSSAPMSSAMPTQQESFSSAPVVSAMPTQLESFSSAPRRSASKISSRPSSKSIRPSGTTNEQVLHSQKADGSWILQEIASILSWDLSQLVSTNPYTDDENVWAAALALAFMELNMQDTKNKWTLVARKGIRFIKKTIKASSVSYDDITTAANNWVSSH